MPKKIAVKTESCDAALRKVKFTLTARSGCKVYLAGSFNGWDGTGNRMRYNRRNGHYSTTVDLAPGIYEYKFLVDDEWLIDPSCDNWVSNCFDTLNSIIRVD